MAMYLARRAAFAALLVFTVSSSALVLARLAPGDFAQMSLGVGASPEAIAAARERLGLNRSLGEQYRDWLAHAVRLDFGRSLQYGSPVRSEEHTSELQSR